CSQNTHVPFTF
nr:immunoglobulin light chain junction region [Mus musculus]